MATLRFERGSVLTAAFEILRESGFESLSARKIAERAECSVQPIYSQFGGMDGLMSALYEYALQWVVEYNQTHRDEAPNSFSANGRCHIYLAKDEPNVFLFLYQSPFMRAHSIDELFSLAEQPGVLEDIQMLSGMSPEWCRNLYVNMIIYTHGIASLVVSGSELSIDEISSRMDAAFFAFSGLRRCDGHEEERHE